MPINIHNVRYKEAADMRGALKTNESGRAALSLLRGYRSLLAFNAL